MSETGRFVNDGFGWECKRCRALEGDALRNGAGSPAEGETSSETLPRFFREGEAEGGGPRLASRSLARWADESRTRLLCPACGAEEEFEG